MSERPDLSHFVQHRQLDAYEQSMARQGYAYGVDLRRSRWLATSTVGNSLVRAVDRAWPTLAHSLMEEAFVDGGAAPAALLHEIIRHMSLLRAPLPTLRLLRPRQRGRWPLVTALGATHGGALWLVLDVEALQALPAGKRAFLLGAGLGHLHCEHGVFFTAHLLAGRREGSASIRGLRSLLVPWTKVMVFSADRAGLLCCGDLDTALDVVVSPPVPVGEASGRAGLDWLPPLPDPASREQALREFARSAVFTKLMATRARQTELMREITMSEAPPPADGSERPKSEPIHVPADAWSLARVDARLTRRLALL